MTLHVSVVELAMIVASVMLLIAVVVGVAASKQLAAIRAAAYQRGVEAAAWRFDPKPAGTFGEPLRSDRDQALPRGVFPSDRIPKRVPPPPPGTVTREELLRRHDLGAIQNADQREAELQRLARQRGKVIAGGAGTNPPKAGGSLRDFGLPRQTFPPPPLIENPPLPDDTVRTAQQWYEHFAHTFAYDGALTEDIISRQCHLRLGHINLNRWTLTRARWLEIFPLPPAALPRPWDRHIRWWSGLLWWGGPHATRDPKDEPAPTHVVVSGKRIPLKDPKA